MMLFHHWPLDRAAGIAPALSSLGTKRVAGDTTPGRMPIFQLCPAAALGAKAGAPNGTRTRIASVEDSHSSFELWAHEDREEVDPTVFPTDGVHPGFRRVPARLSKENSDNRFPATRPGPGKSRWRPDKGKQKTPRSFPRAGFEGFPAIKLGHVFTPHPGLAFPARLVQCAS